MAYAAYSDCYGVLSTSRRILLQGPTFVVMGITVASTEALQLRRALTGCKGADVLRCIPKPHDRLVTLEVHLPADATGDVMHCVIDCVPSGQIGHICSWKAHLARHGLAHGH